jgi:cytosine/uracil/thiamine/allantoin permease
MATGNLYDHVGNVWGIPFPKKVEQKYGVLDELFGK